VTSMVMEERWWKAAPEGVHDAIAALAKRMAPEQETRRQENALLRALYGAKGYETSVAGDAIPNLNPLYSQGEAVWRYNLIRAVVEVLEARITLGRPKATFVTNGGSWAQQRRAKRADRFVYGVMHATGFYREARKIWRDAAVTDLGVVKGWVEDGKICLSRVDPDEIQVEVADGYYGKPRTMLHTYLVSREQARAWVRSWHEGNEELQNDLLAVVDKAASASDLNRSLRRVSSFGDVVEVHEAWHLPSSPGASDDRHTLSLSNGALLDEGTEGRDGGSCTFFPFAFFRCFEPFRGFYGQGLAELAVPHQRSVNMTLRRISKIIHNMATSRWWVDKNTQIATEHLATNESATVLRGGLKMPQVLNPAVVPPDLYRWADYAIARGLEQFGINEAAVSASKPAGLDSGKAIREHQDVQSSRHAPIHFGYEEGILDTARLVVRLAKQSAEDEVKLTAFYPMGRRAIAIDWSEVAIDEESFQLQIFSTASLPTTPAARKQYVDEQFAAGLLGPEEYRRLLDMPDQEAFDDAQLAARDVVEHVLEKMLDGDDDEGAAEDYTPPEPFDDVAFAVKRGMQVYQKARLEGAPEGRLALVRRYILKADELRRLASQPPAPPAGAAPEPTPPMAQAA
jgi:hypothetical protein